MYRDAYQRGMLTVFFSIGSKPLAIWDTYTKNGYITRFLDQDIKSMVLEIGGTNVSTTYMTCPKGNNVLGITMPFLVMIVKNLNKYFSFEVTILDSTGTRRRFRVSNFQSTTQILPLCTVMPISLTDGWNQIQFNLSEFTQRAYKKQFVEVQKIKINANIRLRRIYFAERLLAEDQLPSEYKLYFPLKSKGDKAKKKIGEITEKENIITTPEVVVEEKKGSKLEVVSMWPPKPMSTQSIKRPSYEPLLEQKKSQILAVKENTVEQINAITDLEVSPDDNLVGKNEIPEGGITEEAVNRVESASVVGETMTSAEKVGGYEEGKEDHTGAEAVDVSPEDVDASPKDIETSPGDVDASPKDINASPEDIDATPKDIDASPREADVLLEDVDAIPETVNATSEDIDASRKDVDAPAENVNASSELEEVAAD